MTSSNSNSALIASQTRHSPQQLLLIAATIIGVVSAIALVYAPRPEFIGLGLLIIFIWMAMGMKLEILLIAMLVNVLIGSARLFESPWFNINRLLGVILVIGLCMKYLLLEKGQLVRTRVNVMVFFFFLASIISFLFAQARELAFLEIGESK